MKKKKKLLALGSSNSRQSINQKFAKFVAEKLSDRYDVEVIDINDYEMPLYSVDREVDGIPTQALDFAEKIDAVDLIVLSLAEHNGTHTTAFKNIYDWVSRIPGRKTWGGKDILLLSAATGPRGASTVREMTEKRLPWDGGNVVGSFGLPVFQENFDPKIGIKDLELGEQLDTVISLL